MDIVELGDPKIMRVRGKLSMMEASLLKLGNSKLMVLPADLQSKTSVDLLTPTKNILGSTVSPLLYFHKVNYCV